MLLKDLKLTTVKTTNQVSSVQQRRLKVLIQIAQQIQVASAYENGRDYFATRLKTMADENGNKKSIETQKRIKKWFWTQDTGKIALTIRYGNKVVMLNAKANAIELNNASELVPALNAIKIAIENGALDEQLASASKKVKEAFKK